MISVPYHYDSATDFSLQQSQRGTFPSATPPDETVRSSLKLVTRKWLLFSPEYSFAILKDWGFSELLVAFSACEIQCAKHEKYDVKQDS